MRARLRGRKRATTANVIKAKARRERNRGEKRAELQAAAAAQGITTFELQRRRNAQAIIEREAAIQHGKTVSIESSYSSRYSRW